jgi:cbb3-type cytochrome oxidase subunit 1
MNVETFRYDNKIVRAFAIACVIFAIVGMVAGLLAAIQLFYPAANLNLQYTTFGGSARSTPMPSSSPSSATACSWASTTRCSGSARPACSATP